MPLPACLACRGLLQAGEEVRGSRVRGWCRLSTAWRRLSPSRRRQSGPVVRGLCRARVAAAWEHLQWISTGIQQQNEDSRDRFDVCAAFCSSHWRRNSTKSTRQSRSTLRALLRLGISDLWNWRSIQSPSPSRPSSLMKAACLSIVQMRREFWQHCQD